MSALQLEKNLRIDDLTKKLSVVIKQLERSQEEAEKQLVDSKTQLE